MIFAEIQGGKETAAYLGNRYVRMRADVSSEMKRIGPDLQRHIKQNKLSGQVLKNRTGNLRRAVNQVYFEQGDTVGTIVGVAPNASSYGAAHEFGATIHVPAVAGKLMVFEKDGALVFTRKHKAFTVKLPERSFMRSSVRDKRATYIARLSAAVKRSLVKK